MGFTYLRKYSVGKITPGNLTPDIYINPGQIYPGEPYSDWGIYTLVDFTLSYSTKGNLSWVFISTQVKSALGNHTLVKLIPGNFIELTQPGYLYLPY